LVCKFLFSNATRGLESISYTGALLSTLLHAISHRGALLSTLLHVYMFLHNLLNVLVQIANKMGLQKKFEGAIFLEGIYYMRTIQILIYGLRGK
jgi:hypothetical protein